MSIVYDIKSIAKILQQADNIPLFQKILDIQAEALEVLNENNRLRKENEERGEKLKIKENLVHENNAYWTETQGKKDGPFCSRCWDVDKNLV